MKTKTFLIKLIVIIAVTGLIFQSCKKDESKTEEPQIEYTEDGLVAGLPPMQEDIVFVDTATMSIQIDQEVIANDFEREYELVLEGFDATELKPGAVIVDYSKDGRIWVVKEASTNKSFNTVIAYIGTIATMLTNVDMEISTAGNRAKIQSDNPNKLGWAKFKMISGNGDPVVEFNIDNINIGEIYSEDGIDLSVNANTVELNFTDYELYSNPSGTFNVTIPNGLVEVNNAVDFKVRFNPIAGFYLGVPMTLGSIKEFKSSIYSVVDSDITLNIQATTNGEIDLANYEKVIGSYTKVVPVPPYFFLTVQVDLTAKLKIDTEAEFNITPHFVTKNNFEMRVDYNGLLEDNDLSVHYENVENELATNITGDFNLGQRLEIVPEIQILAYSLIGPSAQIIPYEKLNLDAELIDDLVNWDVGVDVGMDYKASLDVTLLNFEDLTESIINKEGNFFNFDLYNAPYLAEITSGNSQTGDTETQLTEPIRILVKDNFNNPVPLAAVHFITDNESGIFENDYVYTNLEGVAENYWTLGSTEGVQMASIKVKDGEGNTITGTQLEVNATATGNGTNTPTVTTNQITNITETTATCGGNVTDDAGYSVIERGVCWNTSPTPTVLNNFTNDGTGVGTFTSSLTDLTANTRYYIRAYATNSEGTAYGNQVEFTTLESGSNTPPIALFTVNPNSGTTSTNFTFDASGSTDQEDPTGELLVRWDFNGDGSWDTDWNTNKTETHQYNIEATYTAKLEVKDTEGLIGQYSISISVSNGGGGGTPPTGYFTDPRDGQEYAYIEIGDQTWMAENLNYEMEDSWWFDNDEANGAIYGRLYKWDAAIIACPSGWHLSSDNDWKVMEMYLGMSQSEANGTDHRGTDEGGKMKEPGTYHWSSPNNGATNSSGFAALPGGFWTGIAFDSMGTGGVFWTSTLDSQSPAPWYRVLGNEESTVWRNDFFGKSMGLSARCVKDQ